MIAFQLVQTRYNYWKDLFSRLMSRQESVFLSLRNQIELSWLDTHVLRFNFPFLSGQTVKIMNSNSKKIKMSRFKNLFKNIKKKNTIKRKTKGDKISRETKSDVGRKRALLTHKYKTGRRTKVKKVGR
jgi:hypothetical protein